ncbi:general secretion pathway protein GspK [Desulfonema magnum]|uniref:Type II secretion system protein, protein K n=1 Tax=Desulfonema magnum TaxID=45655 RepID=A0A975BFK0_9BACT|nr:helix-hairpin-helix domain-containing protein [Desulfonema magnum]QTA84511.1 Type II secretion system protein, protein K [Desulfonema magnum]
MRYKKRHFSLFPENENGIALFLVLWVLTLLSVIVGEFCHTMRTEVNITRNFKEETQAYYIATAGVNVAIAELIKNKMTPRKPKPPDADVEAEEDEIEWRINADIPAIPFAEGQFKVQIGNESGKININKAGQRLLKMVLNRFELDDDAKAVITDSILDWRDKDNLHRLNGAEDDYYLSLPEPYECKDGNFDAIEELLLVRGITPEMFHRGLRDMVTIYGDEEQKKDGRKKSSASDKININAASLQMLSSLPEMTDDLLEKIMEHREENDFKSLSELLPIVGDEVYSAVRPFLSSSGKSLSSFFTIKSVGTTEGSTTTRGVQVLVKIDTKTKDKYRIIKWVDDIGDW